MAIWETFKEWFLSLGEKYNVNHKGQDIDLINGLADVYNKLPECCQYKNKS